MTLPKTLPLDHPRVEQFREDLEDMITTAFEEGVHIGVLIAGAHRAASMMMVGAGGTREEFLKMASNAWKFSLEEAQIAHAIEEAAEGNGAKA
jgi:hypothetical protein